MALSLEELDDATRSFMLTEFRMEIQTGDPYMGRTLSIAGRSAFLNLMEIAITTGDDTTLFAGLNNASLWSPTETYVRNGVIRERRVNVAQAAERLAVTEFNTWYVRGFAARLLKEGVMTCQVYRAAEPKWVHADCHVHEGQIYDVAIVYEGHRARYWPEPGHPSAISVPYGPGCHHTIRRGI